MIRRRVFIRGLLIDLFAFSMLFCLLAPTLFAIYKTLLPVWLALGLAIPFYAMSAVRFAGRLPVFIGSHMLLTAWPLLLPGSVYLRITLVLFMFLSAAYSVSARCGKGGGFPFASLVLGILLASFLMIFSERFGLGATSGHLRACAFVMTACYLVCSQTSRLDYSLDILQDAARQPVKTTLRFNNAILIPFLSLCAVAALLSGAVPINAILGLLAQCFKAIARVLLSLLQTRDTSPPPQMESPQPTESPFQNMLPPAEPSRWMEILDAVFKYLGWTLIIVLVLFLTVRGARRFLAWFYSLNPADGGDLREYIGPDIKVAGFKERIRSLSGMFPLYGKSWEEKIRRAYYRKVKRHIRRGAEVKASDTAGEIWRNLSEREDLSEITWEYNQARYGGKD